MQHLDTDRGAKAELKAANAIPVNGQISNGRLRDGRSAMHALKLFAARSGIRANGALHRFDLRFSAVPWRLDPSKPLRLVPRFSNLQ